MDFTDVLFYLTAILESRAEESKARLIAASFTAWQIRAAQGDKTPWDKYIAKLGLSDRPVKLTKLEKEIIAHKAHSAAERIIALDKKREK